MKNDTVILMLSFERFDLLQRTFTNNLAAAGCDVDVICLDQGSKDPRVLAFLAENCTKLYHVENNIGIAKGYNFLMKKAYEMGYTYIQFMANDILEDQGWVMEKVDYARAFPEGKCGMISIFPGSGPVPGVLTCFKDDEGNEYKFNFDTVIGQFFFTRQVIEKVGYFKDFGTFYAPIDNDYNVRCVRSGLVNFYLPNRRSHHIDDGAEIYDYSKTEQLERSWPVHVDDVSIYNEENSFIPYHDESDTFHMREYL